MILNRPIFILYGRVDFIIVAAYNPPGFDL